MEIYIESVAAARAQRLFLFGREGASERARGRVGRAGQLHKTRAKCAQIQRRLKMKVVFFNSDSSLETGFSALLLGVQKVTKRERERERV